MKPLAQTKDLVSKVRGILPRKTGGKQYHAALDIGTEMVKALVFTVGHEGKAHVWGVGRQRQKLSDMQHGAVSDIAGVTENTEKALALAEEMAKHTARQSIIGIAGELVKGSTTRVEDERENPQSKITIEELNRIMNRIEREAAAAARREITRITGLPQIDVRLVNASIVDMKIDGYKVTNPIGFQGKTVAVLIYNAFAPLVHLGALETVSRELGLEAMSIAAEPYAIARSVAREAGEDFSAIFLDIGGGTTDLALVVGGGLLGTEMFAIGGRSFTKRLATLLKVPFLQAEEIKLKYSAGLLSPEEREKIAALYSRDIEVWLSGVELALEQFSGVDLFPSRILLAGGGSLLPEVKKALEGDWWKHSRFAREPAVEFLSPTSVSEVVDHTGELKEPRDMTGVGLVNLARTFSFEESLLNDILRKVTKTLEV